MYLLYASKEVLILRINFVIVIVSDSLNLNMGDGNGYNIRTVIIDNNSIEIAI